MSHQRKIIATSALAYANGPLHLGHMVEYIQTDIWVRFQKMRGEQCFYICGSDAHGTPIMIKAKKDGISPTELITKVSTEHQTDFKDFLVEFDSYCSTHCDENQQLVELIYQRLKSNGDISTQTIAQAFDPVQNMFLPDRFVKGTCPRCKTADQYGDSCEQCGATYSPLDLINPVSVLSGATPIEKQSEHLFFNLQNYAELLTDRSKSGALQSEVVHKLDEWFKVGLKPWDISRDEPYFGFSIPEAPGKYFYVWLDAPVGYMASFKKLCDKNPELSFDEFWQQNSQTELYHFLGKDVVYFHALFWPAMLNGAKFRTPTAVFTHGFLTVDGQKMSKSRGTFIKARTYLDHLSPEYLRYYFACKLNDKVQDLDLNWDDFQQRINSDLVGKVVNIASRCAGFINKNFAHQLSATLSNPILWEQFIEKETLIANCYESREYSRAMREIMELADAANQYIDEQKPWAVSKANPTDPTVQAICSMGLNLFRVLAIFLKPILPNLVAKSEHFLNCPSLKWHDLKSPLLNHTIEQFVPLLQRIDPNSLTNLKNAAASLAE